MTERRLNSISPLCKSLAYVKHGIHTWATLPHADHSAGSMNWIPVAPLSHHVHIMVTAV